MRSMKEMLFTFALVAGLSVGAFAQKEGEKKPPPKPSPPVVNPQPKPPPKDDKPKKPGNDLAFIRKSDIDTEA